MKHKIDVNNIELYRRNLSSISTIFEQAMSTYLDDNMKAQDELISVDSIEDISTGYILTPIHIYVSECGLDIDIVARHRWQRSIVDCHREEIIKQMRERKLFPNLFVSKHNNYHKPSCDGYLSQIDQYKSLESLATKDDNEEFEAQVYNILFCQRVLLENELLDFCKLLFMNAKQIEIRISSLNHWSKNSKFLTIGSFVPQSSQCKVLYEHSSQNVSFVKKRIVHSCPNILPENIQRDNHTAWLKIIADSGFEVSVYPKYVRIFTDDQFALHIEAFVNLIEKQKA